MIHNRNFDLHRGLIGVVVDIVLLALEAVLEVVLVPIWCSILRFENCNSATEEKQLDYNNVSMLFV